MIGMIREDMTINSGYNSTYNNSIDKLTRLVNSSLMLMLLLLFAATAQAANVIRGPYLQTLTDNSVIIKWRTNVATDSIINYGLSTATLSLNSSSGTATTEHSILLSGLQTDTRYYYNVAETSGVIVGDASYSFKTAPLPGTAQATRIWVIGDSGTANQNARDVRDAYKAFTGPQGTDVWLMLGDNAYNTGTDGEYQNAVFNIYPELLRQTGLWSTLGNHDGISADSTTQSGPYYDIFALPDGAQAGGLASGTEAYYSFDYANIHFVNLESFETDRSVGGAMLTWLESDLAATTQPWIIAFWHHPPYSKGSHDSDVESRLIEMRTNALPILESYGVDLVLSGHSHAYERSFLLNGHYGLSGSLTSGMVIDSGDGRESGNGAYEKILNSTQQGAVYAVAGSSGLISGGLLNHPAMYISLNQLGSMVLDVDGLRLDAKFITNSGAITDSFTLLKTPDIVAPYIISTTVIDANTISLVFSERLLLSSAEFTGNYVLTNGVLVTNATLNPDGRTVVLTTQSLTEGLHYILSINGVQDLIGNLIQSNSQTDIRYRTRSTIAFQNGVLPDPGYTGMTDTNLNENAPGLNDGNSSALLADGDDPGGTGLDLSALLKWNIDAVPGGATIESATITVVVFNPSSDSYPFYALLRDWAELETTWNDYALGNTWQTAGAKGSLDRGTVQLAMISAGSTGFYTTALNSAGISLLQQWLDGTTGNYGFILANSLAGDGLDFTSSEYSTPLWRPRLSVSYLNPIPADLNNDGRVDSLDMGIMMSVWGSSDVNADLDNSGVVDSVDLEYLILSY
ncbi:MAG: hypothetical protein BMS9Abin26_2041 [Gammaproteobacteria bacterium]|nr:MAG: hypothetical protein BMS9Abin26_2041 [Gammaproteobacteria bacterium]